MVIDISYSLTAEYGLPPVFYLDAYPINDSLMVIVDPEIAQQVVMTNDYPKHSAVKDTIEPLAGRENLVTSEGALWKKWRTVFNPAFSVQQLMGQVPMIVDYTEQFAKNLDRHASRARPFRLEEEATKLTIDVIGRSICDHDFGLLETDDNEFVKTMRKTLSWMPDTQAINPFHKRSPIRSFMFKYYKRQMDSYIGKVLDERFSSRDLNKQTGTRQKTGIDLALEEYHKESGGQSDSKLVTMNADFRRHAVNQLLILLFAGHDTTASTICYAYYELSKAPEKLARLRKELDDVFGKGIGAAEQLKQDPYIINKCEYTLATIREILRMWAPASTVRQGSKGQFIRDPVTGNMLPTDGFIVWVVAIGMHRDPRLWSDDVHEFKPERFLPENLDQLPPNGYRPFEKGPRNCIGQELAILEMKIALALTVREFDVTSAYDELEELDKDGSLWATEKSWKTGPQECYGSEAYQVLLAAGKPREGMPARVTRRAQQA